MSSSSFDDTDPNNVEFKDVDLDAGVPVNESQGRRYENPGDYSSSKLRRFSIKWTTAIEHIRQPINRILLKVTHHAASYPKSYICGVLFISILIMVLGLLTNFSVDVDEDVLWTPRNSRPLSHGEWVDDESGFPKQPRYFQMVIHRDGQEVLGQEGVRRAFEALDEVRGTPGYSGVCAESHTVDEQGIPYCKIVAATKFWNDTTSIFEAQVSSDEDAITAMSADKYPDGSPVDNHAILGNSDNENGTLTFAQSYLIRIDLPDTDDAENFEETAIDNVLDLKDAWEAEANNIFRLEVFAERSFSDEFTRAIVNDIPLVPIVFVVMSIFTCLVFAKRDKVRSRSLLGFGAVVSVLLSIMTGYGLLFLCGIPFTSMSQILPFIMFGIGLDDAFIISGAFFRTNHKKDPVDRIQDTIEDVGLSITLTTITSALAFGLGCISSIPAVYWLCLYAFPTIIIDFLYQVTFFVALLVIDERRVHENRRDCCVWKTVEKDEEDGENEEDGDEEPDEPTTQLADRFMGWYAEKLLRPWVKTIVVVLFAALLGMCAYSATQLTQAFEFTDVVPKGSYVTDFFNAFQDYSARGGVAPNAYFRFVDQSNPNIQQQMEDYINDLVELEEIPNQPSFFWLRDFKKFVNSTDGGSLNDLAFNEQIDAFLADPVFHDLYADQISRDENGNVIASLCTIYMDNVDQEDVTDQIDALENQRKVSSAQLVNENRKDWAFFTFDGVYYIWEFYSVAVDELILTTVLGVVAVSAIGMLFIPHWTATLVITPFIIILYIDLLGVLQFAGVHVNAVSYISLVMSIGLLVDFIMHGLLRYYESSGNRKEKTKEMLQTMGSSILVGGISTFLGVIPLAFSTSEIFSTIFLTFLGLVLLGITHGLILLPVILSTVGTNECIRAKPETEPTKESGIVDTMHGSDDSDV